MNLKSTITTTGLELWWMSGSSKDGSTNARHGHDRSLQTLLVALAVTGTIAASMIVIAFATSAGGQVFPDETAATSATESEPEDETGQAAIIDDRPLQPDKQEGGFAEYIDSLLANSVNYEKDSSGQARLAGAASDAPESGSADEPAADGRPPHEQTASEPDDNTKSADAAAESGSTREETAEEDSIDEPAEKAPPDTREPESSDGSSEPADEEEPEGDEKAADKPADEDDSSQPPDDTPSSEPADEEETILQAIAEILS